MSDQAYDRASEIQQRLTETGKHRSAGPVELLFAERPWFPPPVPDQAQRREA
jgi:hypothetical protein